MTEARVVFAGTPVFALACLDALLDAGRAPVAVYTQPERPAGRGRKLTASPVKARARAAGIAVRQPQTLKDRATQAELAALEPDLIVVAAYGLLLPQAVLDLPRAGCVNVHASLLPRWRGASPVEAAILAGDGETGVSLMRMEAGLDSGPVYARRSLAIGDEETAGELRDRLAALGAALLLETLPAILDGTLVPEPQEIGRVTSAGKLASDDARLDWRLPAADLARQVRAFNPVPGARFDLEDSAIKVWRARAIGGDGPPGTVVASGKAGLDVACGGGVLRLLELQRPGRGRVSGAEFARQRPLPANLAGTAAPPR